MRRVFLDVGASDGSSVKFFRQHHPKAHLFDIYSFEPLPSNIEELRKISEIVIVPKAAWSSDGVARLYIGKYKAGTMFSDKKTGLVDPGMFLEVETIDFAKFVMQHFEKTDELWLKLNVEGAEYEIVRHLHKHNLLSWFDRIYVCWHAYKIPSLQKYDEEVKAMIPNAIGTWRKKELLPL
jgi:FkbM family methyltransferase